MTTPILSEGIKNIEDLDVKTFIDMVRRIESLEASEKLDGTALWFGLDAAGSLFTSRPNSAERYFAESEYSYFAANNGIRGAHAALQAKEQDIRNILSPNDTIEISVLYGRQPNSITYGLDNKNFIAFVQAVEGTNPVKKDQLVAVLENSEVSVKITIVDSPNGEDLDRRLMSQSFRFVGLQKLKPDSVKVPSFEKQLKALEKYLDAESGVQTLSNFDLMTTSLGSIPKEEREEAKAAKDSVISTIKNTHMRAVKKELLDKFISKIKPILGAADAGNDEDVGVEGVVFNDPMTGEQFKIVDSASFSTLNDFNFAVRNQIAGVVKTLDDAASIEARGGIVGQMKIRLADLLGNKELALTRSAKQIFSDNIGDSASQTLKNVAKTLNGGHDFNGTKRKAAAVVAATVDELAAMLAKFKKYKDDPEQTYRLKLANGKAIGMSQEMVKRTLLAFAEAKRNLVELHENVNGAQSFEQLIAVLYGRAAKAAHASVDLSEHVLHQDMPLLLEMRNFTSKDRYAEVQSSWDLLNIYVATIIMATIIYKADDKRGIRFLRDKPHFTMAKWSPVMSPVNFWGYPVWHAQKPAVAKLLKKGVAAETDKVTKKIPWAWIKFLHMDLSFARDVPIDWHDHYKTMKFLIQHAPLMNINRVNTMLDGAFRFDELTHDEKVKLLPKVYFYAQQYVPTSPIMFRIRAIQNKVLAGSEEEDALTTFTPDKPPKLLGEDGEIAGGEGGGEMAPASTGVASATTSQNVATTERGIGRFKNIVRRKRNPDIKAKKFERPTEDKK